MEMECAFCHTPIAPDRVRRHAKFCGFECKQARDKEKYRVRNERTGFDPTTVGTLSELRVAVDLMMKGYYPFRALSPGSPCDLAILAGNRAYRVEVATSYKTWTGKINVPSQKLKHPEKYDILAMVVGQDIVYRPALDQLIPTKT